MSDTDDIIVDMAQEKIGFAIAELIQHNDMPTQAVILALELRLQALRETSGHESDD